MKTKRFSIAGATQIILSICLIFCVLAISSPSVSSEGEAGCCANPGILYGPIDNSFYCSDVNRMNDYMCCPSDTSTIIKGGYNSSNDFFPDDQADCLENFYSQTCEGIASETCTLGCCFNPDVDPTLGLCSISTEYICFQNQGVAWREGSCTIDFHNCPPVEVPPTTTNITEGEDTCSQYDLLPDVEASCKENGCTYCPSNNKCFSSCFGNCPGYFVDRNSDSICDTNDYYSPCPENLICQETQTETCLCGSGLVLEGQYCCELQGKNFTAQDECISSCGLTCGINQKIYDFFTSNYYDYMGFTECQCGSVTANLNTDTDKYCCTIGGVTSLSTSECNPKATLTGYVYEAGTSPKVAIKGADVLAGSKAAKTDASGKYTLTDIPSGVDLVAVASNDSFIEQAVDINLLPGTNTLEFNLSRTFSSCENPKTLPDVEFKADCPGTSPSIILTWKNPCPTQFKMFKLFRGNTLIGTYSGTGSFRVNDTEFAWEKNANYTLFTTYITAGGSGVLNDSLKIFTGYEACIGRIGKSICVNNNIIRCEGKCTNTSYSCGGTSCIELSWGDAMCVAANTCEDLGNPFGVFYEENKCYFKDNGQPNPCYFDYSKTTIDKCYRCSDATSCSVFLSENACTNNPCGLSSLCSYLPTNTELGKGICYRKGDYSSDSCELCNSPFMGCTSEDCDTIGNCGMTLSGCKACSDVRSCSDYADEYSCIGENHPYTVGPSSPSCVSAITSTPSDDSCGIGYCRWLNNKCIKDIDYNGVDDTGLFDIPPVTSIKIPNKIIMEGDVINFSVTSSLGLGVQTKTFYCISPEGTICCPTTEVSGSNIMLTKENNPNVEQGRYIIYFYSNYMNIDKKESVKKAVFYADLQPPAIHNFDYKIEDYTKIENSNLTIYFNVSENSVCSGSMGNELEGMLKKSIRLSQKKPMQYMVKYINLTDGDYTYIINCTDFAGNKLLTEHNIRVDRVGAIITYRPNYETLASTRLKINATVTEDGKCALLPRPSGAPMIMVKQQVGGHYVFSYALTSTVGSKVYLLNCELNSGLKDTEWVRFTIDTVKPVSSLKYSPPGGAPEDIGDEWHTNTSVFSITCTDPSYPPTLEYNTPPMFGCNGTRYCAVGGTGTTCNPAGKYTSNIILNKVYKTTRFCYQSIDAGGNVEDPVCTTVQIDSMPPSKPNVAVPVRFVDDKDRINVTITSTDSGGGLKEYGYVLVNSSSTANISKFMLSDWIRRPISEPKSFLLNLSSYKLAPGKTYYVAAIAVDKASLISEINLSQPITVICKLGINHTKCNALGTNCTCDDCGDEDVQEGEECDDGNTDNKDECTTKCKLHKCGDGFLYNYQFLNGTFVDKNEAEECDDGNTVSGDGCDSDCRWEKCGDGIKNPSENCDDGNILNTDSCVNCYKAYCGDGYTYEGNESCDYRNSIDRANCKKDCTLMGGTTVGTCSDNIRNNGEGDVDCGGNCTAKCGVYKRCGKDSDCESNFCNITAPSTTGFCASSNKCFNGVLDIGEADKDCGTICSVKCSIGKNCKLNSDCESQVCTAGKCVAPSCTDLLQNGNESDVDCGGTCTAKCDDGKKCKVKSDCKSGLCKSGYCEQDPDKDDDGMDDIWESRYCGDHCDPEADPDKDGLKNLDEFDYDTDPTNPDTDGDGWKDGKEVEEGTNPTDPDDHPKRSLWWLWLLLFLILLLIVAIIFYVYREKSAKKTTRTQAISHTDTNLDGRAYQRPVAQQMQPIRPLPPKPIIPQKRRFESDHSDLFKPFIEGQTGEKPAGSEAHQKPAAASAAAVSSAKQETKKPGVPDLDEGHDMPGWMKDRSGVWRRLEKMNTEELNRMGKADVDVSKELSGMYGKRLDKNAKDSLTRWVLSGIISKANLAETMKALAKDGKLNKAVLRYILEDMLSEKKMTKTEMKSMLKEFPEKGILSERDSDDMIDFVKDL